MSKKLLINVNSLFHLFEFILNSFFGGYENLKDKSIHQILMSFRECLCTVCDLTPTHDYLIKEFKVKRIIRCIKEVSSKRNH